MVSPQLKSMLSSYGGNPVYSVSRHEYAYVAGRAIHFHNLQSGTSRLFFPEKWLEEQSHTGKDSTPQQPSSQPQSTRDLFRTTRLTSTPNTSATSHDSQALATTPATAAPANNSNGKSPQQHSLSVPTRNSTASHASYHSNAAAASAAAAAAMRKSNHLAFNPFQKFAHELNPAGITALAFSLSQGLFAFAEKKLNPSIHIYNSHSLEHLLSLPSATKIEYSCLNFSRDGKYLVSLGSIPDYSITIWNVKTGAQVASAVASSHTIDVTFDPRDSSRLCSSGANGHLVFWSLMANTLRSVDPQLISPELLSAPQNLCHTWGKNSDIYVGTEDGDIVYFPSIHSHGDLMSPDQIEGTEPIRSMVVSKYHLITGSDDGVLRFYSLDSTKEFCRQVQVATSDNQAFNEDEAQEAARSKEPQKMRLSPTSSVSSDIVSIILNPPYDELLVGCADGALYHIHLENYSDRSTVVNDMSLSWMNVTSRLLVESHCGSINGIGLVGTPEMAHRFLVTAGDDGSVRLWNYAQNSMRAKIQFNASLTSMKCFGNWIFVASSLGYLRVIDVSALLESQNDDTTLPQVIYCAKIRNSRVEQLDVDSKGNCVLRFSDHYIALITVHASSETSQSDTLQVTHGSSIAFRFAGFVKSESPLTCAKITDDQMIYMANDECVLARFKVPTVENYGASPDFLLNTELLGLRKWRLDYPALDLVQLHDNKPSKIEIITLSLDKSVKFYDLGSVNSMATLNPVQEVESHLKAKYATVALNASEKYIATGADDGLLWIRSLKGGLDPEASFEHSGFSYLHNAMENGIKSLCFGFDENPNLIFTCGGDGAIFISEVNPHENAKHNAASGHDLHSHPESVQERSVLYLPSDAYGNDSGEQQLITDTMDEEQSHSHSLSAAEKEKTTQSLAALRDEFEALRMENEEAPDDEKVADEEFILDEEYVASIEGKHDEQVKQLKERIRTDNLKKELLTQRIIEECFNQVEKHSEDITGLYETRLCVTNYSLPKVDEKKEKLLKKINFMRRVEEVDLRVRRKVAITRDLDGGIFTGEEEDQQYNEAAADHETNRNGSPGAEEQADQSSFEDDHLYHKYVISEYDIKNRASIDIAQSTDIEAILYNKFDLYTRQRKVSQMWLLHGQVQQLKRDFNQRFKEVQELKNTVLSKIDRVNSHIVDIVEELEYDPQEYVYNIEKVDKNILEVTDDEIPVEKWISPEERARREEEERRKKAALANSKEAEIVERALHMMMDGRLEDKSKKKAGIEEIPKPACLEKPAEELSDAEKKQIVEYEKAVKEFEEEEIKKRKQQEAKLKNAQNDIADTCNVFDQKLKSLFANKLHCDRTIFEIELTIVKLAQSVLDQEDNLAKQKQHKQIESQLEQQNTEYVHTVQRFEKTVHEYMKSCDDALRTIAEMERGFKESIIVFMKQYQQQHPSDYSSKDIQDMADRLARLFPKSKSLKLKIPTRQEFMQRTQGDSDPFADISAEKEWAPPALSQSVKRPENATDWLWNRFMDMRKEKILMEYNYLLRVHDLEKRKEEEQRLREHTKQLEEIISRQIKERNKFNEKVLREQFNLDYLFNFKQGQIEVEQQAVVTDYGDAVLLSKQNIVNLNRQIIEQAKQNIDQMRKIMDLSKKIEQINWENEALLFEADEKDDVYQRFQRLRVTKEMQNVLKTGHNNQELQERDRDRLVEQIAHTKKTRKQRVREKKKIVQKIAKNVERTSTENSALTQQLDQLQRIVGERKMIVDMQSTTAAKERQNAKMKQLRMERKLKDLSQAQSAELDYLRKTIQVLRERTFPSFALTKKTGI